jgi:hypothetical protein
MRFTPGRNTKPRGRGQSYGNGVREGRGAESGAKNEEIDRFSRVRWRLGRRWLRALHDNEIVAVNYFRIRFGAEHLSNLFRLQPFDALQVVESVVGQATTNKLPL